MCGKSKTPTALLIDWQQVCLTLRSRYKPLATVAKEVGSDWRHLNRLARGEVQQPRFDTGLKLLDLLHDVCPDLGEHAQRFMLPQQGRLI